MILWQRWTHSLLMEIAPNTKQMQYKTLLALVLRSSRWKKSILYHPTLMPTCPQPFLGWGGDGLAWTEGVWHCHDQPPRLLPKRAEAIPAPWQSGGWHPKSKGYAFCNANSYNQTATCCGRIKGLHKDFSFISVNRCNKYLWGEQSYVGNKLSF